jgi:hypothetical protein
MAYVVARLFDWRALFGNYMSRHQKKPHRPYPAPQEQQQQGRPENGQPPAPKPFNMRRVVAISFALAVAIVLLSYGVNRREQAAMQSVEPPMASDTGVIPDSEAQAEERAARRAASQEKGMTAPADDASAAGAASEPGGLDAASDASAASAW